MEHEVNRLHQPTQLYAYDLKHCFIILLLYKQVCTERANAMGDDNARIRKMPRARIQITLPFQQPCKLHLQQRLKT